MLDVFIIDERSGKRSPRLGASHIGRVSLAQALWESINAGLPDTDEQPAVGEAIRRDQELSSSVVAGRTHKQVMQAARRAIGCFE
jgi:hypothetical protein